MGPAVSTDQRLRRAYRDDAHSADSLRWRLRAGQLAQPQLELAAYCGSASARRVIERCSCGCGWPHGVITAAGSFASDLERCTDHTDSRELSVWVHGLSRWGHGVQARAAVAVARAALEESMAASGWSIMGREVGSFRGDGLLHISLRERPAGEWMEFALILEVIEAAEAWLACECATHYKEWVDRWIEWPHVTYFRPLWTPAPILSWPQDFILALADRVRHAGTDAVRNTIQTALISWALGNV